MKVQATASVDNRNIEASFKLKKEDGESDFFSNLFSADSEMEDLIEAEDELDD